MLSLSPPEKNHQSTDIKMRTHTQRKSLTHSSFSLNPEKRWLVVRETKKTLNRNLYNLCVHVCIPSLSEEEINTIKILEEALLNKSMKKINNKGKIS